MVGEAWGGWEIGAPAPGHAIGAELPYDKVRLGGKALALEAVPGLLRALVPGFAGVVLLEARPRVDDQQRTDALGMRAIECKRHVAAEREPADGGVPGADLVEQRRHVRNGQRFAVGGGIIGIIGLAVAAHVPQDQPVLFR